MRGGACSLTNRAVRLGARHATRCPGRSCLWKRGNSLPCRRSSARPAAARRPIIGVTVDRPSRHARAQRANPSATSCSVPTRRTSCSRESPSPRGREGASGRWCRRRSTISGDASAATWYHAALSTRSASSSDASASGTSIWHPGCAAADWNLRASSSSSDARLLRFSPSSMRPCSSRRPRPDMGLNDQSQPGGFPSARVSGQAIAYLAPWPSGGCSRTMPPCFPWPSCLMPRANPTGSRGRTSSSAPSRPSSADSTPTREARRSGSRLASRAASGGDCRSCHCRKPPRRTSA